MTSAIPSVFALEPHLLPTVWGGDALQRRFGKEFPADERLGESWEASCVPGRLSRGPGGATLADLARAAPGRFGVLPGATPSLLIKLLATSDLLSVQVHPDDASARRLGDPPVGKHEGWVVLDAGPEAEIYLGLAEGATCDDLFAAVAASDAARVRACLRRVVPRKGDVFEIAPGTVHAPGAGVVLYEVQQPSDLTYRLFDWNRVGLDGRPRELHRDKARAVVDPSLRPASRTRPADAGDETLLENRHFTLRRRAGGGPFARLEGRLEFVTCTAGTGTLAAEDAPPVALRPGTTCAVLRDAKNVRLDGAGLDLLIASPAP